MRQVVLDTETTGLRLDDGHRIIEIGCIELVNRKVTGKKFHQYVNPERAIDEGALKVHGLTSQFLETKPLFADIAEDLMAFIKGAELIIHNAPFDVGYLNFELSLTKNKWKPLADYCRIVDTLILARQLHTGQRNSLDALCKRYQVDNSARDLHGALLDAHLLAEVYLAMTGGQGSLFDELKPIETTTNDLPVNLDNLISQRKQIVIQANPEEMSQHEEQLQKMLEKGKCLWLETDT